MNYINKISINQAILKILVAYKIYKPIYVVMNIMINT